MQTQKGYITQAYSSLRSKAKRRGDLEPNFSKLELQLWLYQNNLHIMWIDYLESDCNKNLKPSIDRIDDYGTYEFSNMQLITWRENQLKGVNGDKHHKNSHNKNLQKKVKAVDKIGFEFGRYDSVKECAEALGVHNVSVSRALNGTRKTIKGYTIALTGEELTIK